MRSNYGQEPVSRVNKWRITNDEEAGQFLHQLGLRVEDRVVRDVVDTLQKGGSLYSLYTYGIGRDGRERNPVCSKATAGKIRELYRNGELEPYFIYLSSVAAPNEPGTKAGIVLKVDGTPLTKWRVLPKDLPFPELVVFKVSGSFQLTNLGMERTIERIYCRLVVDDREITTGTVFGDPNHFVEIEAGWRIRQLDKTLTPKEFYCKCDISRYDLQRAVGFTYEEAQLELVVEATGARGDYRFPTSTEESLSP